MQYVPLRVHSWKRLTAQVQSAAGAVAYLAGLIGTHARLPGCMLCVQSIVSGVATPLAVWAMTGLVDALAAAASGASAFWPVAAPWLALLLAVFFARGAQFALAAYVAVFVHERLQAVLQRQVFEQAVGLSLASFERPDYYQKLEIGQRALHRPPGGALTALTGLISVLIGLAGLLLLFARAHWLLAVVLVVTTALRAGVGAWQSKRWIEVTYRTSPERREMGYWATQLSSREAAPELRLFGLAPVLLARWRRAFECFLSAATAARRRAARANLATSALQEAVGWVVILALLLFALQGAVSIGSLVALLYGLSRFRSLTDSLSWGAYGLVEQVSRLAHLREFLALKPEPQLRHARANGVPSLREGVRFHNVSFTYPGADRPALANVTLTLRPQERVALVGENGAGKTTLVRLLLGLYRPDAGRITVDGTDLTDLDPAQWRRRATAIFQDFMRYPTSVAENIGYADVALLDNDADLSTAVHPRIVAAAEQSGAAMFVADLPTGYATPLGKEFEAGVELSAGQWQRLAIARAYLRDAQIVVLDEPTAALDPRAEVAVYRQFREAAAGRCAVFISHRLGSARLADRIIVLREGRVVEEGSHAALLAQGGEYARMYRLQASWYGDGADGEAQAW